MEGSAMATERAKAEKIDLNEAGRDELIAVPGIGPAAADAILAHRKQHGRFKNVDELANVPGIGATVLEGVRGHVGVASAEGERGTATKRAGERPAEAAKEAAETGGEALRRTAETAQRTGRETAAAAAEAAGTGAELARRAGKVAAEGYEEFFSLTREEFEGLTRAQQALLDGGSELSHVWLAFWREQLSEGTETMRALAECRNWHEALERQNAFTRASVERACAQAARSAELTAAMINESFKPLQETAQRMVERAPRR
jgi:competence protein ComEA